MKSLRRQALLRPGSRKSRNNFKRLETIAGLAAAIETARAAGAFSELEAKCQIHVAGFIDYVDNLRDSWRGESQPDPVALAVGVVKTLLGSAAKGVEEEKGEGEGENTWLSLKWGIAVVARGLDMWCVGDGWEADELCTLCTFGECVDPLVSVDPMALSRPGAGRDHGGLQPGGGLGLLVGLLSEYLGTRKTEAMANGVASQAVTLPHEILDIVGGEDGLAEQQAALEAMARINAAQGQV